MNIESTIKKLLNEITLGGEHTRLDPNQPLIDGGILDSLALLKLVSLIEEQLGVTIEGGELIPQNFQTINAMKTFLEHKLQKTGNTSSR